MSRASSQRVSTAVMARRHEPPDGLDYFPTPPWATRALVECVLPRFAVPVFEHARDNVRVELGTVHEPACGEGHMAAVLAEYADKVHASDIFPYGYGAVADFLDEGEKPAADWIITNPPFNKAVEFARAALTHPAAKARRGVALLVRLAWLEGGKRFAFFAEHPPALIAAFAERVPMVKGRWDPRASTATAYCWIVWSLPEIEHQTTQFLWIPPGQRERLTRPDDAARFAARTPAPLLDGGAA